MPTKTKKTDTNLNIKKLLTHFQQIRQMTPGAKKYNAVDLLDKYDRIIARLASGSAKKKQPASPKGTAADAS